MSFIIDAYDYGFSFEEITELILKGDAGDNFDTRLYQKREGNNTTIRRELFYCFSCEIFAIKDNRCYICPKCGEVKGTTFEEHSGHIENIWMYKKSVHSRMENKKNGK